MFLPRCELRQTMQRKEKFAQPGWRAKWDDGTGNPECRCDLAHSLDMRAIFASILEIDASVLAKAFK